MIPAATTTRVRRKKNHPHHNNNNNDKIRCTRFLLHNTLFLFMITCLYFLSTLHHTFIILNDNNNNNNDNNNRSIGSDKRKAPSTTLEIDVTTYDDPPILKDTVPIVNHTVQDFDSTINAVIVTKIHGPSHLQALRQMLCLLHYAYNDRTQHDIVIFTSEPIPTQNITDLQSIVAPTSLRVIVDNPGLHTMVRSMSSKSQNDLLDRCGVTSRKIEDLTWYHKCTEIRTGGTLTERLAYTWQAEFRAVHLWTHDVIQNYKYMLWIDADAYCTRRWNQDPISTTARYDLKLFFDHFPQGSARGREFPQLTQQVFQKSICSVSLINGTLHAHEGRCKRGARIQQVHGFLHVSNLDFFRSSQVMEWNHAMIRTGDKYQFSRLFDDQIGITIPAAILAGNQSRDMKSMGVTLRVIHNYVLDGFMKDWRGYYVPWWDRNANTSFPQASDHCVVDISG